MRIVSAYLSGPEEQALDELCDRYGLTVSALLRLALRRLAGLPIPSRYSADAERDAAAAR